MKSQFVQDNQLEPINVKLFSSHPFLVHPCNYQGECQNGVFFYLKLFS
jgi:hypothetical protein